MITSAKGLMDKLNGKAPLVPMHASAEGLSIVRHFEGMAKLRKDGKVEAYLCPAGVPTIGIGSTLGVKLGMVLTLDQCEARFVSDVRECERALNAMLTVQLKQGQFDALISMVFNFGAARISKSTIMSLINAGRTELAADEFLKWNKSRVMKDGKLLLVEVQGLTRRRKAEMNCYLGIPHLLS